MAGALPGKKVAILAADGVEQVEYEQPREAVANAGASVELDFFNSLEEAPAAYEMFQKKQDGAIKVVFQP